MFGALDLWWKGVGLSSGRDSLFYSAWELWRDRKEIEESKVNAELSQVRDIYVWVTTVYSGPNQTCFVQHHVGGACTTTYTRNASLNIVFDGFLGLF